jgi:hypothetical protein
MTLRIPRRLVRCLGVGCATLVLVLAGCAGDPADDTAAGSDPATEEPSAPVEREAVEEQEEGPEPMASGTVDPCALLSEAGIAQIIGTPVDPGRFDENLSSDVQGLCQYDLSDGAGFVQVLHQSGGTAVQQRSAAEEYAEVATEDVPELPEGFYSPDIGAVGAQAAAAYVQVAYHNPGTASREEVVALMEELLAAL